MTGEKEKEKKWVNKNYMLHENELWLNEQAEKGLILTKFDNVYASFIEAAAENIKYKIVILNKKKAENQIRIIEQQGFTFVGSYDEYYIFQINGKYGHIQPRMNEEMTLFVRKWLDKQMVKSFAFSILAMFPLIFALIMARDKLIQTVVEFPAIWAVLLGGALVVLIIDDIREFQAVRRTKKCLLEHEVYQSGWNLKKSTMKRAFACTFCILIAVLSIKDIFIDPEKFSINDIKEVMPIVLLQDIEQDPEQAEIIVESQRAANEDNYAEINHTLLAQNQYYALQDSSSNHMRINYYEVAAVKLAEPLARELLVNDMADIKKEDLIKMDFEGLDAVYSWQEGHVINVSAIKGKRVMSIFCIGDAQLEDILKEMAVVL